ncbi:MAG: ParB/Srx family N-terminal domain-containing protein, partial [Pseudomonadota bacterium]|nr:ParB/Srx family N-terminal domain-containing protein [Pseudomonadota bacterium]
MTLQIRDLAVTLVRLEKLQPYSRNSRTHSKMQIGQIAESIKAFGWTNPLLIDPAGSIIAGHGRYEAAKLLGLTEVPAISIADLTEAQRRAYIIADNKLAENAGWDRDLLSLELGELELEASEFSIDVLGFETAELDIILNPQSDPKSPTPVDLPTG